MLHTEVRTETGCPRRWAGAAVVWTLAASLWGCGGVRSGPAGDAPVAAFQGMGALPGDEASEALAVSGDGRVVVGASGGADTSRQAFLWTQAEGLRALGVLAGGATSSARAA